MYSIFFIRTIQCMYNIFDKFLTYIYCLYFCSFTPVFPPCDTCDECLVCHGPGPVGPRRPGRRAGARFLSGPRGRGVDRGPTIGDLEKGGAMETSKPGTYNLRQYLMIIMPPVGAKRLLAGGRVFSTFYNAIRAGRFRILTPPPPEGGEILGSETNQSTKRKTEVPPPCEKRTPLRKCRVGALNRDHFPGGVRSEKKRGVAGRPLQQEERRCGPRAPRQGPPPVAGALSARVGHQTCPATKPHPVEGVPPPSPLSSLPSRSQLFIFTFFTFTF